MKKKQNRWLVTLLCLNALLITAVVTSYVGLPQAHAQVVYVLNHHLIIRKKPDSGWGEFIFSELGRTRVPAYKGENH